MRVGDGWYGLPPPDAYLWVLKTWREGGVEVTKWKRKRREG